MAAPIRINTATAIAAEVVDLEQARRLREPAHSESMPDEIQAEYERASRRMEEAFHRDFGPSVYRALLTDLASWPAAFQRRVGESLRRFADSPEWIWQRFEDGRQLGDGDERRFEGGCRCGCEGFNGEFVNYLQLLRTTAGEAREARAKGVHSPRATWREELDERKRDLLKLLWLHGQRRIDRARLREHAAEHVRAELSDIQRWLAASPERILEHRERLRVNATESGNNEARALSPQRRLEFERFIEEIERETPKRLARAAELEALLSNPHALVRRWTGCERTRAAEARA
jgi:hypothetical protein